LPLNIAASSDRVNLQSHHSPIDRVKHPIDGREHLIQISEELPALDEKTLAEISAFDNEQLFWWLWRFYPEAIARQEGSEDYLLFPAHHILPDCPLQPTFSRLFRTKNNIAEKKLQETVKSDSAYW
jgi:CRISPR-associated protein Cmr2